MQNNSCCCETTTTLIFACAGGSNVGQLSNEIGIILTEKGTGKLFCLAGIGGNVSGIVKSTESADNIIVIDGCQLDCAKKTLEEKNLKFTKHIRITELGVTKNHDLRLGKELIDETLKKVEEKLNEG